MYKADILCGMLVFILTSILQSLLNVHQCLEGLELGKQLAYLCHLKKRRLTKRDFEAVVD